ncbi:ATP-dependent DNA helicase RecG [Pleurocapsa sp. PCC 7319]|uniref:ATP-dependent DNA helicase RecG n=1 Tax=Pleurocapsa sp. PCC 7319 TaxID=118161 RepID=UPI0003470853|nr:ATP-dependent DNA helicase RecG [Pleurocapsa sp. PCC 7319]
MSEQTLDWVRLQKALSVEAERGYIDLIGNQYRFSEFICLSLGKPPRNIPAGYKMQWHDIAQKFAGYDNLSSSQRKQLVISTRNFLYKQKAIAETPATPPKPKVPRTTSLNSPRAKTYFNQTITLDQPLSRVIDIGRRSSYLERLGLYTVRDLLFYYPRDHLDYARQVQITHLEPGETVTVIGTVKSCKCFTSPKNKKLTIFELILTDATGRLKINRFLMGARFSNRGSQERYKRQYPVGSIVAASGLVKQNKYGITLDKPEIEVLDGAGASIESIKVGRVLPVYALTEGVPADTVRKSIIAVLPAAAQLVDPLPSELRNQYGLVKLKNAIACIHFPENYEELTHARRRLVFDEFFYLQLGFLQRRQQLKQNQSSASFAPQGKLIEQFNQILPFKLTNAQERVINEIFQDLGKTDTPMNRLVQGDVGSGKTVVAVFAILAAIQSGYQAALMAPTEVLAEQHYRKLVTWFNLLHLPVELLTGSTKTAKRREIHSQLENGELPLLVGTHALIQDSVNFHKLGLAVIDEQHRFGVQQRARLLGKGKSPHVLTMTATPIPRTLALTLHGDLDVSQIDELPPGRQPISTMMKKGKDRKKVYDLIRREIAQGRQAYIIFPLVEESEKLDLKAATEEHKRLSEVIFPEFKIALLHGRMSSVEKDVALTSFRDNESQIIVSTTVIEVGVDVPNATVMVIEHAERFGLSQLHQLRGRIGRGSSKSFCFLMSSSKNVEARQRLAVLEESQDGFFISEADMRFRGPGAVLGTRQSGLPDFALASLVEDQEVLNLAREAAEKIIAADKMLDNSPSLKQELEIRYRRLMGGDIWN